MKNPAGLFFGAGDPRLQSPVPDGVFDKVYVDTAMGQLYASQNGVWSPLAAILVNSSIPVILAPNGTIATNGTVTLGTALPVAFPSAWVFFPAGAVVGGLAGVYYVTFSSTTVGQVYTNYVNTATTDFTPFIPASPVAATGSNSAYTTTTGSDLVLLRKTIPGGVLGATGAIRKTFALIQANNANNKTIKVGYSGGYLVSNALASVASYRAQVQIQNYIDQAHQHVHQSLGTFGGTGTVLSVGTTDTSQPQAWVLSANLATATDFVGVYQNLDEMLV